MRTHLWAVGFVALGMVIAIECASCVGDDGSVPPKVQDGGSSITTPDAARPIDGFDLGVKEGSWWQYSISHKGSYGGSTGTGSFDDKWTVVLKLGAPTTIAGDPAFPVEAITLSVTPVKTGPFSLAWKYMSFVGKRIRASADGTTWSVLFDANTGIWPATSTGLFGDFPGKDGVRKAIQNGALWVVREGHSTTGCESIPPYGSLCTGAGDLINSAGETYDPAIGLVASEQSGQTSNNTGFSSTTSKTVLMDSSVHGDRPAPSSAPNDGGTGNGCVDIPIPTGGNLDVIAAAGSAPSGAGGVITNGNFVATAIVVYGTAATPGTVTGRFAGNMRITGATFENAYASSAQGTYYSSGSFTTSSGTVNLTNTCSSTGPGAVSFGYSVTSGTTIDLIVPGPGYTTVTTYTKQ